MAVPQTFLFFHPISFAWCTRTKKKYIKFTISAVSSRLVRKVPSILLHPQFILIRMVDLVLLFSNYSIFCASLARLCEFIVIMDENANVEHEKRKTFPVECIENRLIRLTIMSNDGKPRKRERKSLSTVFAEGGQVEEIKLMLNWQSAVLRGNWNYFEKCMARTWLICTKFWDKKI